MCEHQLLRHRFPEAHRILSRLPQPQPTSHVPRPPSAARLSRRQLLEGTFVERDVTDEHYFKWIHNGRILWTTIIVEGDSVPTKASRPTPGMHPSKAIVYSTSCFLR